MRPIDLAVEFAEQSAQQASVPDLLADLQARLSRFGFPHLMMTTLPTGQADVRPLVMMQGWPEAWFERYVAERYYLHDAVTTHAAEVTNPFRWNEVAPAIEHSPIKSRIAGEATEFGLSHGLLIPMYAPRAWQAVVSVGGPDALDISPQEEAAVLLMAHYANRHARRLLGEPQRVHRLSTTEREVVSWTAAGKSIWDISVILSVSQHTIDKRLRSARRKLDVVNNTQLVAEALRQGEISP